LSNGRFVEKKASNDLLLTKSIDWLHISPLSKIKLLVLKSLEITGNGHRLDKNKLHFQILLCLRKAILGKLWLYKVTVE